jgi:hypothetical protein
VGCAALNRHSSRIHQTSDKIAHGINTMETTAVQKTLVKTLGISAAAVALALFAYGAQAQAPKTDAPKAAAKKAPPKCTTLKDEAACNARDDCTWSPEVKDAKGKVKTKASCKVKPKAPAKADPKKK